MKIADFGVALALVVLVPLRASAQDGDAAQGKVLYQRQCAACHQATTARNSVGPTMQGVVGRVAGSVAGFNYSPALKGSGITWSKETLDTYLANPGATVKGVRMVQRVPNGQDRQNIIAYLSTL